MLINPLSKQKSFMFLDLNTNLGGGWTSEGTLKQSPVSKKLAVKNVSDPVIYFFCIYFFCKLPECKKVKEEAMQ